MTAKISASNNQRLKNILETIANQQNISHIDGLLDCLNALVYEINVKTTGKTKNFQNLLKRLLPNSEYIQKQRININDFTILKVVGKGAYGEVALVRHTTSQEVFALKTMNKAEMVKRDEALCLWEEREIMAFSESEWIVKMLYAFQDTINIYMVMEFVQGGNMVNVMSSYDVDEEMAKFYIAEISLALDFLHNMGFIHRDVKPDNMLLDKNGHIKLCDFGTCVRMNKNGKVVCNVAVGTPDYISPEVLSSQSSNVTYGRECDWWSVGVFLYELLLGDTPFYSQSLVGTYSKILSHAKTLKIPEDAEISKETKDLIHAFLCSSEVRLGRNGIEEIKKHPFFKDVLWKWDEIRTFTPPIVPELVNEIDTSCFDFEEQTDKELLPLAKSALVLRMKI
uniref:non-specific serine/threonine protein kinase n=1 Tax=Henneguya salminicola TaxID=69463 RepID=A0A6G3MDP4_HENSL